MPGHLDASIKTRIREALERLAAHKPGFRRRRAQNIMIAECAKTVAHEDGRPTAIAIEGGTGTGKSLGYCLGVIPVAQARQKTVVIATATVALQEQLLHNDLPALQQHAGLTFEARLAKGRTRWVCDARLHALPRGGDQQGRLDLGADASGDVDDDAALWDHPPSAADLELVARLAEARAHQEWDGDLDAPPRTIPSELLPSLTATRYQCTNQRCPHFRDCAFFAARRSLDAADVVVTNHALLLADLALGGGVVLPDPEDTVYVIDEAHHLGRSAIDQFAKSISVVSTAQLVRRLKGSMAAAARAADVAPAIAARLIDAQSALPRLLDHLVQMLEPLRRPDAAARSTRDTPYRLLTDPASAPVWDLAEQLRPLAQSFADDVDQLVDGLADAVARQRLLATQQAMLQRQLAPLVERLTDLAQLATWLAEPGTASYDAPVAKWASWDPARNSALTLHASPISAGAQLRQALHDRADAVLLTSATLCSLGDFSAFYESVGLDADRCHGIALGSPFDLERQATLRIVGGPAATPSRSQQHTEEVVELITAQHAQDAGTLVLFTSHRQMGEVAARLPPAIRAYTQCQGEAARALLLERHRTRVAQGEPSILFGVNQLSEGLDLPGKLLEILIVAKLPFATPDDPISRTREAWIRNSGRDYFNEVVVPEAHLRLIQMCGRLIRTETDQGTIFVNDSRLRSTGYGRRMLDTLPPFRRAG